MSKFLEFIFVSFVFLILLYISKPNLNINDCCNRAKISQTKANMHIFQNILETYATNSKGFYPKNVDELKKVANKGKNKYWEDIKNPFSLKIGKGESYDDFSNLKKEFIFGSSNFKLIGKNGCIYYDFMPNENKQGIKYFIYISISKNGEILIDAQSGIPFTLSNN
ncbi:MAG: hypothetical protein AABZ74_12290 [Cyanobacteriota bacterium]